MIYCIDNVSIIYNRFYSAYIYSDEGIHYLVWLRRLGVMNFWKCVAEEKIYLFNSHVDEESVTSLFYFQDDSEGLLEKLLSKFNNENNNSD